MNVTKFEDKESWLFGRLGKLTGSRLKDVVVKRGSGKKVGYYELIAERLGVPPDGENPMERGTRLESEAITRFQEVTHKQVDTTLVMWSREDNESIAISPDGVVSEEEAVECKCLSSARHIEAYLTQQIPDEYHYQMLQYFAVNEKLQVLNFVFYDPRFAMFQPGGELSRETSSKPFDFFFIQVKRKDVQEEVDEVLAYEEAVLEEIEAIVINLTF